MQMSQDEWVEWQKQRRADAPKIARQYELEANRVVLAISERGCPCNPMIDYDPARTDQPQVTHSLDCTNH